MIRLLSVLKNTMKWPGRHSPAKGDSPPGTKLIPVAFKALGPPQAAQPQALMEIPCGHPAVSGRMALGYLFNPSLFPNWAQATLPPPLLCTKLCMKALDGDRKSNKQCSGLTPAMQHNSYTGKVVTAVPMLLHHGWWRHP